MIEDDLWTFVSGQLEGVDLEELDDIVIGVIVGACLFAPPGCGLIAQDENYRSEFRASRSVAQRLVRPTRVTVRVEALFGVQRACMRRHSRRAPRRTRAYEHM
jgi:hypothetical protein